MMPQENLEPFFRWYAQEPNQMEAIQLLQSAMPDSLLKSDAAWIKRYREQPIVDEETKERLLDVQYMWQQDNGPEGWRQCQTSSIAMCLKFLGVDGINDDVDYLRIVQMFGDTTLQSSHIQALKSLGVKARFRTDGGKQDLINRIKAGYPVPIGILHHGHVSAPSGGGHYIVVIGVDETHAICHDPFGELSLVNGTWDAQGEQDGKLIRYSWTNLLPRWDLNNGTKDGWYWEIG